MAKKVRKARTVIVGTYRPENEAWIAERRLYNLPLPTILSRKERKAGGVHSCATVSDGHLPFHEVVTGVVLFAEGHQNFAFKARFKEVVDGAWLKKNGYSTVGASVSLARRRAPLPKPHGTAYALYELYEESTPAKLLGDRAAEVFVSSSRCPCVKIDEAFYSKPYPVTGGRSMPYVFDCLKPYFRKWKSATTFNPVQGDFFDELFGSLTSSAISVKWDLKNVKIEFGDSLRLCEKWQPPTVIVSDGPYGLGSYPGDPVSPDGLAECYRPFLVKWYERSLPSATLWFWNSEQGWANCHRMIEECGWEFRNCHIWDKGISHVAGNCNTRTIRKYPVVTEVCAQYVRKNYLKSGEREYPLRDWMREEWRRTGLPFRLTNEACGVKDAATRKYFSKDHLWYFPPSDAFIHIAAYANKFGNAAGRPYFCKLNGEQFTSGEWDLMRAKFHCEIGVSNVWSLPAVRGTERIKVNGACLHMNQKPLELLERIIRSSSDPGDVVWEPFGGLCSTAVAALRTSRKAFAAEINPKFYNAARERLSHEIH